MLLSKGTFTRQLVATLTLLSFLGGSVSTTAFAANNSSSNSDSEDAGKKNKEAVEGSIKSYAQKIAANAKKIKELEQSYKELCENAQKEKYVKEHKKAIGEQQSNAQCDAIKQTLKTAKAQDALWKVWGATAAVCLSTCMMSILPSKDSIAGKIDGISTGPEQTLGGDINKQLMDTNPGTDNTVGGSNQVCTAATETSIQKMLKDNKGKMRQKSLYYPEICAAMNAGASLADGIATKQLMSAMMGLATSGMSMLISQQLLSKGKKLIGKGSDECGKEIVAKEWSSQLKSPGDKFSFKQHEDLINRDYGSCMTGVQALMQMGLKIKGAEDNKNRAKSGLTEVAKLLDLDKPGQSDKAPTFSGNGMDNQNMTANVGTQNLGTEKPGTSLGQTSNQSQDPCSGGGGANSVISCAVASDHRLPNLLRGDRFKKTLENVTGMGADHFFDKLSPENASSIIAGAASGQIFAGKELNAGLEKTSEKGIQLGMASGDFEPNSSYRSGFAHAPKAADSSGDPDLSQLMNGVLSKFGAEGENPEKTEDTNPELNFQKERELDRTLASDDSKTKGFNIFQRISRRYRLIENQQ